MTRTPIIFFGNQKLVQSIKRDIAPITDILEQAGHPIVATILTKDDFPKVTEALERHPDAIAVLASFGYIVPERIFNLFEPRGILNIHPSLLPKYRGSTPVESAILNGDTKTGISIMKIVKGMDSGPIYAQATTSVSDTDTKFTLCEKLTILGAQTLLDVISKPYEAPTPQSGTPSFTEKLDKSMAPLDFAVKTATQLDREIRAFLGFPRSRASLRGVDCIVTSAHVADAPQYDFDLRCTDGKYLVIDTLIPANSREMSASAFALGH